MNSWLWLLKFSLLAIRLSGGLTCCYPSYFRRSEIFHRLCSSGAYLIMYMGIFHLLKLLAKVLFSCSSLLLKLLLWRIRCMFLIFVRISFLELFYLSIESTWSLNLTSSFSLRLVYLLAKVILKVACLSILLKLKVCLLILLCFLSYRIKV